jgi:hypothetical protein
MKQSECKLPSSSELTKRLTHLGGHRMRSFVAETALTKEIAKKELSLEAVTAKVHASLEHFYAKSKSIAPGNTADRKLLYKDDDSTRIVAALLYDQEAFKTAINAMDTEEKERMSKAIDRYFIRWALYEHCSFLASIIDAQFSALENSALDRQKGLTTLIEITKITHETGEMVLTPVSVRFADGKNISNQEFSDFESDILPTLKSQSRIVQLCTDVVIRSTSKPSHEEPYPIDANPALALFIHNERERLKRAGSKKQPTKKVDFAAKNFTIN